MTAPLTPADCDLRDFPRMMVDIPRLFASEFDATDNDTAWRYGVTLWLKSFHQVPAASLPDDDRQLAKLCGLGRDVATWKSIREEALRGWLKATDGLLYHPVVAEMALECWLEKLAQRLSSGAGNAKRWGSVFDPAPVEADLATGADHMERINPKSRSLPKARRRHVVRTPDNDPTGSRQDAVGIPAGSQGEGKGREEEKKDAGASSVGSGEPMPTASGQAETSLLGELTTGAAKAKAWQRDASFVAAWDACTADMRGRSASREKTWPVWARAAVAAGGPERLLSAVQAYVVGDKDIARTGGPAFDRWLRDGKWQHWLGVADAARPAATWLGPADLRAAAAAMKGDGWCVSYLDRCGWHDVPQRTLVSPSTFATRVIGSELGDLLARFNVTLEERKAA